MKNPKSLRSSWIDYISSSGQLFCGYGMTCLSTSGESLSTWTVKAGQHNHWQTSRRADLRCSSLSHLTSGFASLYNAPHQNQGARGTPPITSHPYRNNPPLADKVQVIIDIYLAAGLIRHPGSQWASLLVMVRKTTAKFASLSMVNVRTR